MTGTGQDAGRMILRGAQATAAGFAGRLGARLLFLFVAGRLYGADAFGAFVLGVAAVELAVAVGSLGMKKVVFSLLDAPDEGRRARGHILLDAALLVTAASAVIAAAIAAAAVLLPERMLPGRAEVALLWLAPTVAGQSLLDLFLAATRWRHAIRFEVVARSLVEPWALLVGAAAAWMAGLRADGLILGYWCGSGAALLYALWGARSVLGGLEMRDWRPRRAVLAGTLRLSAANTLADLANALYTRVDLWLVGLMLGAAPAGVYGMARQVAVPIRQVRQSFDGLLIPLVSRTLSHRGSKGSSEALASATRLILALQLPMLVAIVAAGRPVLGWLGDGFASAYWPLVALAAAEVIQAAFSIGDLVFVYLRPRLGLWLTLAGIAAGTTAALLLIPRWELPGAALSVLAAYGLRAAARAWVLRQRFHIEIPPAHLAGPFVAAAAGVVSALTARALGGDAAATAAGLLVYAGALWLWLRASGQRLALTGFTADAPAGNNIN